MWDQKPRVYSMFNWGCLHHTRPLQIVAKTKATVRENFNHSIAASERA